MYPDIRTFSFGPNDNIMELHIEVLDDDIVEDMEDHMIILRVPEGETGVNLLQESVIIRVLDDDGEGGREGEVVRGGRKRNETT